ncbi:MAG: cytochrome b/b6 domain-containing protein [Rhodobacterales bacterium]|nr:cytochrome b/b6 domain-containing protein [Rhodobacterales bacterium]
MPRSNSAVHYGSVTKTFHWLTALLILSAIPLGLIGTDLAHRIEAGETDLIARATLLFSLHKTIGIAAFATALGRILWALSQPRPGLLHGERRAEAALAGTVHWLLYGAMLITPLSGWVHHAATTGFAPIWWPLGQTLPFVPQSTAVADAAATVHFLASRVLILSILLHVAGALKHHFIDRDDTLRRMLPRASVRQNPSAGQPGHVLPFIAAGIIWLGILGAGAAPALIAPQTADAPPAAAVSAGNWQVEDGTLGLSITQMGSTVTGSFAEWTADIRFADDPAQTVNGDVRVEVVIASLGLGSVTGQAMGGDFFDEVTHPRAVFAADILREGDGFVAEGTLTIKGNAVPVRLPFDLTITDQTAEMSGTLTLDRRDFGIGTGVTEEGTLGFGVTVTVMLTARQVGQE